MSFPKLTSPGDSIHPAPESAGPPWGSSLLPDIRIEHGPHDVLGRFFLLADYALRESGVTLGFGTFAELVETNRANRDTWLPLLPTFDPCNGLLDPEWAYTLIGRNPQGRVVTVECSIQTRT